jgi:hypothetical protein
VRSARTLEPRSATEAWTPLVSSLLPTLSVRVRGWTVLKNHDHLPAVTGDIDTCLAPERWDDFVDALAGALEPWGGHEIVTCDHYVGVRLVFVARVTGPTRSPTALEIDLADGVWWKGSRLVAADAIADEAVADPRGFRRSADGWEAAVLLTRSAMRRDGALRTGVVDARRIREKATADAEGFRTAMSRLHGPSGADAAERFLSDRWTAWVGLGLRRHLSGTDRAGWPMRTAAFARRKAMRHWRGLPREVGDDPERWLERVGRGHACRRVESR